MDDSVKYGLVLPIVIKTIAKVGDEHNARSGRVKIHKVIFNDHKNARSSYDSLCQRVRKFEVYKMKKWKE